MSEILKHPNFSWLLLVKPHGQAMAPGPTGSTYPTWPSHANGRATQTPRHGRRKGSGTMGHWGAPSHMSSSPAPLQEHSWQQNHEPPSHPSPPLPQQRWQGGLGHDPRGSCWQGSGKRAVHPTVGTRDVLGKSQWSQFSECAFASSSINLVWGLISFSHNHETVNTCLHLSKLLVDTDHDQSTFLPHIYKVLLNLHLVGTQRYSYRKWLGRKVNRAVSM